MSYPMNTLETVLALLGTVLTAVGGTKLFDKWHRRKSRLEILDEQMDRIDHLHEKLLQNEDRLRKAVTENSFLRVELEKCKQDVQEWRNKESTSQDESSFREDQ